MNGEKNSKTRRKFAFCYRRRFLPICAASFAFRCPPPYTRLLEAFQLKTLANTRHFGHLLIGEQRSTGSADECVECGGVEALDELRRAHERVEKRGRQPTALEGHQRQIVRQIAWRVALVLEVRRRALLVFLLRRGTAS